MSANHHPSEATLAAYAAGSLGEGPSLVVATHLALCPACRAEVGRLEAVGGVLLEDLEPAALGGDCLDRVLARLDEAGPEPTAPARPRTVGTDRSPSFPEPLRGYLGAEGEEPRWRWLAPGVRQLEVMGRRGDDGASVRMLRLAPGVRMPAHGHGGLELTLVLEGGFTDDRGTYVRGDVAECDEETVHHQPVVDEDGECICLIATDAPLRFDGMIGRLMQPLIGW